MKKLFLFLAALLLARCGDRSGIDSNKYSDELYLDEARWLCGWWIGQQGGAGEKDCERSLGTPSSVFVPTVDECRAGKGLAPDHKHHCQVKLFESCASAIGGDPCKFILASECVPLLACFDVGFDD